MLKATPVLQEALRSDPTTAHLSTEDADHVLTAFANSGLDLTSLAPQPTAAAQAALFAPDDIA